jgi:hypothetical protein
MKNPKSKLLFILLFILSTKQISAQKNMVDGYIIKQNGDTLKGKIDDGLWSKNPTKIKFAVESNTLKTYDVIKELQGFGINGKSVYVRKNISLDVTPYEMVFLRETNERTIVPDTILMLKHLIKGKINLYYLKDNNAKPHFFAEKLNAPIQELIKHDFIKVIKSNNTKVTDKIYNNQLSELVNDYPPYQNKTFNLEYTETALSAAILDYNKNFGTVKTYELAKKEKLSATVFLQIGVGQYGYNSSYRTPFSDYNFQKSSIFIPSIGIKGLFELPSMRRKLAINTDVNFISYSEGVQLFLNTPTLKNNAYLGFSVAPQYSFYKDKVKNKDMHVLAGITGELPLNNNDESKAVNNRRRFGYKLGVGYRIHKVSMELAYFQIQSNEDFLAVNSRLQRFMFTVGYVIF